MKAVGFVNAFTGGELGPDAWERSDLAQHAKGMDQGRNLIVSTTGPAMSRGGFWDMGPVKDQTRPSRLVAFKRSAADALVLEFYKDGFRPFLPLGSAAIVDVVTPFDEANNASLWFKQIGDVLYLTDRVSLLKTHVIERNANDDWTVAELEWREGPWMAQNAVATSTLAVDGITGTGLTMTSSAGIFLPAHVGALFRLRAQSAGAGVGAWSADFDVLEDYELAVSDGKIYRTTTAAASNKTGTNPPLHETGSQSDGQMVWEYLHDGQGIVRVVSVTDEFTAIVDCVTDWLPFQGVDHAVSAGIRKTLKPSEESSAFPATHYWAEQAFSDAQGHPAALAELDNERLAFAAPQFHPSTVWLTRTAGFGKDFAEFKPGLGTGRVDADDSVRRIVGNSGANILWLARTSYLIAATADGLSVISGADINDPITPDSNANYPVTGYGAADIGPLVIQGPPLSMLYVTRSRDTLLQLKVAPDLTTDYDDLTILADHIRAKGFEELAWQHPDEIVWVRHTDGGLSAFTFHQKHEVRAWTTQVLPAGFVCESICTVPGGDQGDVLWAIVKRTIDGDDQRRLWRLARRSEGMFLDGCLSYEGAAATTISGLDVYEGETVQILGRNTGVGLGLWARHADQVVTGGAITLETACTDVRVGFELKPKFLSLPLDLQGVGTTIDHTFQPKHVMVSILAVQAKISDETPEGQGDTIVGRRLPSYETLGIEAKRFKRRVGIGAGTESQGRDRRISIEGVGPFDLVIKSMHIEGEVTP